MPTIPKDPVMLLSFTNTQLRDNYSSLTEFCKAFLINENDIINKLRGINYEYNNQKNQFI